MPAMTRVRAFGCVLVTMAILVAASSSFGEDWPTYRHDNRRSGRTAERIDAAPSLEECLAFWNANIPAERLVEPDEIARACVFMLSDMSSCVTGSNLVADCGMTSQLISKEPYKSQTIEGE